MAPVTHNDKNYVHRKEIGEFSVQKKETRVHCPLPVDDVDLIYDRLIHEAPYICSDEVEFQAITAGDISWIDSNLVKIGQAFVARNFFSLICAHLGALLYGFSFKSLSTLLLRTGNSSNVELSLIRYLSTFMHLKTWYESNIADVSANGYADVQQVKKMHLLAFRQYKKSPLEPLEFQKMEAEAWTWERDSIMKAVHKDLDPIPTPDVPHHLITYFPRVPMSQFDMVMTQFGIISLVYLFPGVLGIKDCVGLNGFLHLWAIIGKLLGIHDKFNLALYPSDRLYRKIFINIGIGSLKDSDLTVIKLQEVLIEGVGKYAHFTTYKSLLFFGLSRNDALVNYKGKELLKLLTWKDYFYYWLMRILLCSVYKLPIVRIVVNFVARQALARASQMYITRGGRNLKGKNGNVILNLRRCCSMIKNVLFRIHTMYHASCMTYSYSVLGIGSAVVLFFSLFNTG